MCHNTKGEDFRICYSWCYLKKEGKGEWKMGSPRPWRWKGEGPDRSYLHGQTQQLQECGLRFRNRSCRHAGKEWVKIERVMVIRGPLLIPQQTSNFWDLLRNLMSKTWEGVNKWSDLFSSWSGRTLANFWPRLWAPTAWRTLPNIVNRSNNDLDRSDLQSLFRDWESESLVIPHHQAWQSQEHRSSQLRRICPTKAIRIIAIRRVAIKRLLWKNTNMHQAYLGAAEALAEEAKMVIAETVVRQPGLLEVLTCLLASCMAGVRLREGWV